MKKVLARVRSAKLDMEREILSFWIHVDYEDFGSQGVGGISLDTYDKQKETRVGTAFGCEVIRRLLIAFGVNDLSEMQGRTIWVLGEGEGLGFDPKGVQPLRVDSDVDPVVFDDILKEFKELI